MSLLHAAAAVIGWLVMVAMGVCVVAAVIGQTIITVSYLRFEVALTWPAISLRQDWWALLQSLCWYWPRTSLSCGWAGTTITSRCRGRYGEWRGPGHWLTHDTAQIQFQKEGEE